MRPHRGTLILVLGIISLMFCGLLGIIAWVMGAGDLKEMDAGTMDPSGRGATNAGRICGMIATIFLILFAFLGGLFALGMFVLALSAHH